MKSKLLITMFFIAACANAATAIGPNDSKHELKVAALDDVRCKKEVAQYIDTLQWVKQSAGDMVSTKVMNNYVGMDRLTQTISSAGNCAGAQLLRDKRATR